MDDTTVTPTSEGPLSNMLTSHVAHVFLNCSWMDFSSLIYKTSYGCTGSLWKGPGPWIARSSTLAVFECWRKEAPVVCWWRSKKTALAPWWLHSVAVTLRWNISLMKRMTIHVKLQWLGTQVYLEIRGKLYIYMWWLVFSDDSSLDIAISTIHILRPYHF